MKMSWVEKNQKINNRGGTNIRDSRVQRREVLGNKAVLGSSSGPYPEIWVDNVEGITDVYWHLYVVYIAHCTPLKTCPVRQHAPLYPLELSKSLLCMSSLIYRKQLHNLTHFCDLAHSSYWVTFGISRYNSWLCPLELPE